MSGEPQPQQPSDGAAQAPAAGSSNHAAASAASAAAAVGIQSPANLGYETMTMNRRLSNLGGWGAALDHRGSLFGDDLFGGRRGSIGFDIGMEGLFGRRDSMDSTTAALEGAILDLTRRRYSMLGGVAAGAAANIGDLSNAGLSGLYNSAQNESNMAQANLSSSTIAAHQERLLMQQRELEHRQKILEEQRQMLLANMGLGMGGGNMPGFLQNQSSMNQFGSQMHAQRLRESLGLGSFNRNSLGFGALSRSSLGLGNMNMPHSSLQASQLPTSQQWFICNVCNAKAFASKEEANVHERLCQKQNSGQNGYALDQSGGASHPTSMIGMQGNRKPAAKAAKKVDTKHYSSGPFQTMDHPIPLDMESDKDWLTPLHCFVRRHCVEVFTATGQDVATPSKGKRKPITVGQVGIRCPHCHHLDTDEATAKGCKERGSVYYPTSLSSIYNAAMNLLQRHLHSCVHVPKHVMEQYEMLKQDDARSGTSKQYWIESALKLGLVDTVTGIRYAPNAQNLQLQSTSERRNSDEFFSTVSNATRDMQAAEVVLDARRAAGLGPLSASNANALLGVHQDSGSTPVESSSGKQKMSARFMNLATAAGQQLSNDVVSNKTEQEMVMTAPLIFQDDKPYATNFSFHLLSQMQPCVFTEADRLGKRKGLPPGFPGLACRHCFGGFGSGRFFPSSIKTLSDTSKTLNVLHNHMLRCRKCPVEIRETLQHLYVSHNDERSKMKFGSQKAFFGRIWERLHGKEAPADLGRRSRTARNAMNISQGSSQPTGSLSAAMDLFDKLQASAAASLNEDRASKKQRTDV